MYRITKVLNHNTVLAVKDKSAREYLIVGKGVGFGKKITQSVEPTEEDSLYELTQTRDRGPAKDIVKSIEPEYLEIANTLLDNAEHEFGHIDRSILFPMADHIAFAVKRMENKEQISNPLNDDIRVMFYREYKIAENIRHILKDKKQIDIIDDEIGYITLHIHTSSYILKQFKGIGCHGDGGSSSKMRHIYRGKDWKAHRCHYYGLQPPHEPYPPHGIKSRDRRKIKG